MGELFKFPSNIQSFRLISKLYFFEVFYMIETTAIREIVLYMPFSKYKVSKTYTHDYTRCSWLTAAVNIIERPS